MRSAFALWGLLALSVTAVSAQDPPACDGDITVVRVSKLKPGATLDGYLKAVEAHRAFYREHGFKDNEIVTARVIVRDQASGAMSYSEDQFLSLHIRPPFGQNVPGRGDAGYDAFVKQYRDTSDIVSETYACIPKRAG